MRCYWKHDYDVLSPSQKVILNLTDPPTISGGELIAKEETSGADTCGSTGPIILTCGHFTSLGYPPVQVVWKVQFVFSSTLYLEAH
jgi:hypothetical protein